MQLEGVETMCKDKGQAGCKVGCMGLTRGPTGCSS